MKFFAKIKDWFIRHMPTRRRIIQFYTFLLYNANSKGYINGTIFKGNSKYMCVPGMNCYSCPGAVGACPLGALQNALNASSTTTAHYMLGIIGLFGLILGRTICGFLCPIGLGQDLLHKIRTPKLGKSRYTRVFSYLKYVILVGLVIALPIMYSLEGIAVPGFCKYICPAGTFEGGVGLLLNPINRTGSRSLLDMLGPIFTWKFVVLCVIIVASVFMYRPFCRFLCPLGAIYGFFNRIALMGVKLDKNKCTDCGLCIQHCKMDIKHVGDHECINCGECISVCPAQAISWKGSKIFLRGNDVAAPAMADGVPMVDIKNFSTTSHVAIQPINAENGISFASEGNTDTTTELDSTIIQNETPSEVVEQSAQEDSVQMESAATTKKARPKLSKRFKLELTAWIAAIVLLISALVYFNLQPEPQLTDIGVGSEAPSFSLQKYGLEEGSYKLLDETFNSEDYAGKVMVVNFWATWCGPCVAELPEFAEVAHEFSDDIIMVAIHGNKTDDPADWIPDEHYEWLEWHDYGNFFFLQDIIGEDGIFAHTFNAFGGASNYPITVIVGKDGKVTYIRQGSLNYDTLKSEVQKALNA